MGIKCWGMLEKIPVKLLNEKGSEAQNGDHSMTDFGGTRALLACLPFSIAKFNPYSDVPKNLHAL